VALSIARPESMPSAQPMPGVRTRTKRRRTFDGLLNFLKRQVAGHPQRQSPTQGLGIPPATAPTAGRFSAVTSPPGGHKASCKERMGLSRQSRKLLDGDGHPPGRTRRAWICCYRWRSASWPTPTARSSVLGTRDRGYEAACGRGLTPPGPFFFSVFLNLRRPAWRGLIYAGRRTCS